MMAAEIEIRERVVTIHSLFVDGEDPFDPLEYTQSCLSRLVQDGFSLEVKFIIQKHGAEKLSDIPIENFTDFVTDVLGFYKEKAIGNLILSILRFLKSRERVNLQLQELYILLVAMEKNEQRFMAVQQIGNKQLLYLMLQLIWFE